MSTQVQYRRGTAAENNAFTGALAETTVDTTNFTLRVHDGITAGGFALVGAAASQTLSNKTFSGNISFNTTSVITVANTADATGSGTGALKVSGGVSIDKNLYVTGNIYASNIVAVQANTLSIQDPLLYLTANTPYPYNYSIGFFSQYTGGNPGDNSANILQHTGFVKDHTDQTWKLFSNVIPEPGITVDFTNAQYEPITHGNLIVLGTVKANSTASIGGNATVNGLAVNTTATIGSTLGVTGNINGSGMTLTGSLVATGAGDFDGGLQSTPIGNASASSGQFTTVSATGNITGAGLTSNASITAVTTLSALGGVQNTPIGNVTASSGQFTTVSATGNITGAGLTSNGSITAITTISGLGGLQATPIGNAAASTATFTTLTATGVSNLNGNVNTNNIMPFGNANANIGSAALQFNTVFAKATSAQYADLAEKYSADFAYAPGTVVVFGGEKEITVTNCSHDTRVAGIVSTDPAYLMNSGSEGIPIAMTGRVPCVVKGPVNKGDVLVTSEIPGAAQIITPSLWNPGCVLGKALETVTTDGLHTIEVAVGRF